MKKQITDEMRAKIAARDQQAAPSPANRLRTLASETLAIVQNGGYELNGRRIQVSTAHCIAGTKTITDAAGLIEAARNATNHTAEIEFSSEKTGDCAAKLVRNGATRVALLNFANGVRVGGGFIQGARAQEEDLCRCSALYDCLTSEGAEKFYIENEATGSALVSDAVVVSPAVPFFRNDNYELLDQPFEATVITAAAPDQGWLADRVEAGLEPGADGDLISEIFYRRAKAIIAAAHNDGADALVLGAWGCGAFGNDPNIVAEAFKCAIADIGACIPKIVFAIWTSSGPNFNLMAFEEVFGNSDEA